MLTLKGYYNHRFDQLESEEIHQISFKYDDKLDLGDEVRITAEDGRKLVGVITFFTVAPVAALNDEWAAEIGCDSLQQWFGEMLVKDMDRKLLDPICIASVVLDVD